MERTIISWNVTNWLTILLMVAVGYFAIGAVVSIGRQWAGGSVDDATASATGTNTDA